MRSIFQAAILSFVLATGCSSSSGIVVPSVKVCGALTDVAENPITSFKIAVMPGAYMGEGWTAQAFSSDTLHVSDDGQTISGSREAHEASAFLFGPIPYEEVADADGKFCVWTTDFSDKAQFTIHLKVNEIELHTVVDNIQGAHTSDLFLNLSLSSQRVMSVVLKRK